MGLIARGAKSANGTINFGANTIAKSAEVNTDLNTIVTVINGNLDDDNLDLSSIAQTVGFEGTFTCANLQADTLTIRNLRSYATNALAIAGGLTTGNVYRLNDYLAIVH